MGPADLLAVAAAREHEAELPVVQVQALPGEGLVPLPAEDAEPARSGGARMWQCAGGPSGFMLSGFGAWPQFFPRVPWHSSRPGRRVSVQGGCWVPEPRCVPRVTHTQACRWTWNGGWRHLRRFSSRVLLTFNLTWFSDTTNTGTCFWGSNRVCGCLPGPRRLQQPPELDSEYLQPQKCTGG